MRVQNGIFEYIFSSFISRAYIKLDLKFTYSYVKSYQHYFFFL